MGLLDNFICTRYTLYSFIRWPSPSRLPTLPSLPPAAGSFARSLNPGFPNRTSTAVIRIIAFPVDLNLPPPRTNYNSAGFRSPLAIQIKVNIIFWFIYLAIRAYRMIRSKPQKKGLLCTIPVLCCAVLYDNRGGFTFFPLVPIYLSAICLAAGGLYDMMPHLIFPILGNLTYVGSARLRQEDSLIYEPWNREMKLRYLVLRPG